MSKINQHWRTFSIFVSSTFADMQAERDYLKSIILPKVEEELRLRQIRLEIVDLRWGVDTTSMAQEDEREATVLKVCIEEIKRCRPFFIGLLGDRYGWVPPADKLKLTVEAEGVDLSPEVRSVTALEMEFGVLAAEKQLSRSVFYFRESLDYSGFTKERAAMFSDACNFEYTEKERAERISALENLKTKIRDHYRNDESKVKSYTVKWDVLKEKIIGLEEWGEIVYNDILKECQKHAEDTWETVPKNNFELESALLSAFVEDHAETFCGRQVLLSEFKINLLANDKENQSVVLTGESGSGKSAVFSKVYKEMQNTKCFILAHSAGLSSASCRIHELLQKWNRQLREYLGKPEPEEVKEEVFKDAINNSSEFQLEKSKETEIEKLQDTFRELLFTAADKTGVVLLIDALDRFEPTERATHMTWLPVVMPKNIRLLVTAIPGTELKALQYHKEMRRINLDFFM